MLTARLINSGKSIMIDVELIGKLMDFYLRLAPEHVRSSEIIRRCVYQADRLNIAVKQEEEAEKKRISALQDEKYKEYLEERDYYA